MLVKAQKKENKKVLVYKNKQIIYLGDVQIKNWDELSTTQLKLTMFSAGKVKEEDTSETKYVITFQEYAELCKFESSGGSLYDQIYRESRKLAKLGIDFITKDGETVIFNWLTSVRISPKSGTITYKLDEALLPFYKTRKGSFAIINLLDYMPLRGRYALLLYEFLAMWQNKGFVYQTIGNLRRQLQISDDKYKRPYDLMKKINAAIDEINEKTQYSFKVTTKLQLGKCDTVEGITFYINQIKKTQLLQEIENPNQDLIDKLVNEEVNLPIAHELVVSYPRERIIENMNLAIKRFNEKKVDSKGGAIVSAITNDWISSQNKKKTELISLWKECNDRIYKPDCPQCEGTGNITYQIGNSSEKTTITCGCWKI